MATHRLTASQLIPRPLAEVFAFFERPENLRRLTPPSLGFEFLTHDHEMRSGLEIEYRLRPLLGIPVTWRTRIDAYDPPNGFRDIQLRGPYARWEHSHTFESAPGGTLMTDVVDYAVPLGPLGEVVHSLVIRSEIERIFRFRAQAIWTVFAVAQAPTGITLAVAGGTGFVGGATALEAHRRGDRVVVLSHRGEDARGGLPDGIEIRRADVQTGEGLVEALRGVDHLAIALAFRNSPIEAPRRHRTFAEVDAAGTERLVAAAREAGVRRLIYVSGAGASPAAKRHWFRAKWRAEEAVRGSGLPWSIVRPTWIFGPRDVSLNRFVGFARRLGLVPMTNFGRQQLSPVFIDDVATLVVDALRADAAIDQVFEIGGPNTMPMREVIATALRVADLGRPIIPAPAVLVKLAALPMSLLPEPLLTPDAVDFINQPATVDNAALLATLPRRLTPLEEGLRTYLSPAGGDSSAVFDGPTRPIRQQAAEGQGAG